MLLNGLIFSISLNGPGSASERAADTALSYLDDLEDQLGNMRSSSSLLDFARLEILSKHEATRLADLFSDFRRLEKVGEAETMSDTAPQACLTMESVAEARLGPGHLRAESACRQEDLDSAVGGSLSVSEGGEEAALEDDVLFGAQRVVTATMEVCLAYSMPYLFRI